MNLFIEHLNDIGVIPLNNKKHLDNNFISDINTLKLPLDYKLFVTHFITSFKFKKKIGFITSESHPPNGIDFVEFLFLQSDDINNDLLEVRYRYKDVLPENILIIGKTIDNNFIFLDLSSKTGDIKLGNINSKKDFSINSYLISHSFTDFILLLTDEFSKEGQPQLLSFTSSEYLSKKILEWKKNNK